MESAEPQKDPQDVVASRPPRNFEGVALLEVPPPPVKGKAGRPPGSVNKATARVRTVAQLIVEDEEYLKMLKLRIKSGDAPHMEILMWHYAYGKPKDNIEVSGEVQIGRVVREIVIPKRDPVALAARAVNRQVHGDSYGRVEGEE